MGVLLREAVGASGRKWLSCGRIICSHGDQRCWAPDAGPPAGACGSFIDRERERGYEGSLHNPKLTIKNIS